MDKRYRKIQPVRRKITVSAEKKAKLRNRLCLILCSFFLIWALLGFIRSDFFSIKHFVIDGNTHTPESELQLALLVEEGDNIWQLSMDTLEERIGKIPRVAEVSVRRKLPATLVIDVQEKKPLALVPFQEYLFEVGYDGEILGTTQEPQNYGLPMLTGIMPLELTVGDVILSDVLLTQVISAIKALDEANVVVSELNLATENNLVLVTMDGFTVWLGLDNFTDKVSLLTQIIGQLSGRQAQGYLDLRAPAAPAFHVIQPEKAPKNN